MLILPRGFGGHLDSSVKLFFGVKCGVIDPLPVLEVDIRSDCLGSIVEDFDLI
jgi:hypothetical protein